VGHLALGEVVDAAQAVGVVVRVLQVLAEGVGDLRRAAEAVGSEGFLAKTGSD
jgi:hypothetical protein